MDERRRRCQAGRSRGWIFRSLSARSEGRPWLPAPVALDYARRYGARAEELLSGATALKDLGRRFGEGLYEREARFLASQEFAVTAEDVLERRTKHALRLTPYERRTFVEWFDGARLKGVV